MSKNQVSSRTRGLGVELKDLRNNAGLNTRDAARKVGLSPATLNRIELGTRSPSPEEVFGLTVVYDTPVLERERLVDLAREAAMPGWWEGSSYGGISKHLDALINFESEAATITNVELSLLPGLLQTPDYLRAVARCFGRSEAATEKRVAVRVGRQVVLGKPQAPRYLAIVDEAAFRRRIGDTGVMARQIRHMLKVATDRPNVTLQVIPFEFGGHHGMISPFTVITFGKAPPVVYIEHLHSSVFMDQFSDIEPFQLAIQSLVDLALGPAESAELMAEIAAEYERE